jgi:hypothetical protein
MGWWRGRGLRRRSSSIDGEWMACGKRFSLSDYGLGLEAMVGSRGDIPIRRIWSCRWSGDVWPRDLPYDSSLILRGHEVKA